MGPPLNTTAPFVSRPAAVSARVRAGGRWAAPGLEFLVALAVLTALWDIGSLVVANKTLLPSPLLVAQAWVDLMRGDLRQDVMASLLHLAIGYGLGVVTGFALAIATVRFAAIESIVDPMVELLRPISAIAWIPVAILMFGISRKVPIFLIFYASVFPIFINTVAGVKQVDQQLVRAAQMLGASRRTIVMHVVLPAALPFVLAGARLSLGVAWMAMVAAELTGADEGLGWRLFWYQEFFAMDKVMALILTIGVLGYVFDTALRHLQAGITKWSPENAGDKG